jgi:hypothetical protein
MKEVEKRNQKFGPLLFYPSFPTLLHNYTRESWIGPVSEQVPHREAQSCQNTLTVSSIMIYVNPTRL